MKHKRKESCGKQDCPGCVVCDCFVCEVCGLFEGCLTTECPGVQSYREHGDPVYEGKEDFVDGKWQPGLVSCHSPVSFGKVAEDATESR